MRVPRGEQRAGHRHRVVHRRALADAPVVDVAAHPVRRDRVHDVGLRGCQPQDAEVRADGDAHVLEDAVVLLDRLVIDGHAGIVDGLVHDAVGIRLRRPLEVVERLGPVALAGRVHLVDGDDLARLRIGQQLLVVKAPPRRRVAAERLALVL